ncbi:flagellar brake protein [Thalassomonas viridans]|uniref:Flagellar brake protein n=1 Tax=Thalassomonas viridans TaxID=137584 RepID=A0AAF0CAY2_9GAMM|nr:flagellar brake protein [Thalassomonas viridans]WDE07021.1 flagellar brake protein [Thalassomonas viridans]
MTVTALKQQENFFELLPGKYLDLQINHPLQVRLKLQLVGYEIGKYIILKHPGEQSGYRDVLVEGNVVIVRYILEGSKGQCFAFRTTIRNISMFPEKFLILEYPKSIENRDLRLHQRFATNIPATIMADEQGKASGTRIEGIIADISPQGCSFTFLSNNSAVKVNQRDIVIYIQSSVDGMTKIPAKVRNSRYERGKVNVGVQFTNSEQQMKNFLAKLFLVAEFE